MSGRGLYSSDHVWCPVIDLGLPSGEGGQGFFIKESPCLEIWRRSDLDGPVVAIGAKSIPYAVVGLNEAGVGEVRVNGHPWACSSDLDG